MKKIFTVMASMLMAATMMAQEPVITFEKTTHDFGKINEADGRVTTVFNFKNEGMTPLVLSNVRASCGCTTPKWNREPIEPGAAGAITVTYNPNGRPGKFSKTITITSNAKEATTRVYIKGEVIPKPAQPVNRYMAKIEELSVKATDLNLGAVKKGNTITKTIEYANQTNSDLKVEISQADYVDALATLETVKPQQTGQFSILFDANACPVYGPVQAKLYVRVNGKGAMDNAHAITVTANVQEDFSGMTEEQKLNAPIAEISREINLGTLPAKKAKVTKSLRIVNAGVNPLYIRRVIGANDMHFPELKGGIKASKDYKFYVNTTNMASSRYERTITVITNDPKNPVQTIKLTWEVQ